MVDSLPAERASGRTASIRTRRLRLAVVAALLLVAVGLLGGSVADLGPDRRLVVAVPGGPGLDAQDAVLVPGVTVPLDLTVSNPYAQAVRVTRLVVTVTEVSAPLADATRPCGLADFSTTTGDVTALVVPARSSTSLGRSAVPPAQWPSVAMANAGWNQDGCRRASVRLALQVWGRVG